MPTNPNELDQSKRGLQDDHDPGDLGQRTNDKKRGATSQPGKNTDPDKRPEQYRSR
jgi:hypothetical protein